MSQYKLFTTITNISIRIWLIAFLVIPMLMVINLSFSSQSENLFPIDFWINYEPTIGLNFNPNFDNYRLLMKDSFFFKIYLRSLFLASLNTIFCLLISYPLTLVTYNNRGILSSLIIISILITFSSSMLIKIYAWSIIFAQHGPLYDFLTSINIKLNLINSLPGVVIVMCYCYLPFMFLPIYLNLKRINPHLIQAAYDLGANKLNCFRKIILPLTKNGIISGCSFVSLASLGEFVIPDLIGGSRIMTIGKLVWNQFFYARHWPIAAASAITLILFLLIIEIIATKISKVISYEA